MKKGVNHKKKIPSIFQIDFPFLQFNLCFSKRNLDIQLEISKFGLIYNNFEDTLLLEFLQLEGSMALNKEGILNEVLLNDFDFI